MGFGGFHGSVRMGVLSITAPAGSARASAAVARQAVNGHANAVVSQELECAHPTQIRLPEFSRFPL
jgi:hypothetical protein